MVTPGINKWIDHTLLRADAVQADIVQLCQEALQFQFFSVCVEPSYVALAKEQLKDSPVKVCSVIGFPLGTHTTRAKSFEAEEAAANGAQELDMVIHIGALKEKNLKYVTDDIRGVVKAAPQCLVKVIIECCLLTDEEKVWACKAIQEAGAHFVKTSTGFSSGGATISDIQLLRQTVGLDFGVKASGGIRDLKTAKDMLAAGANRLGASQSVQIVKAEQSL